VADGIHANIRLEEQKLCCWWWSRCASN